MLTNRFGQNEREIALRKYFARVDRQSMIPAISLITFGGLIFIFALTGKDLSEPSIIGTWLVRSLGMMVGALPLAAGCFLLFQVEKAYRLAVEAALPKPPDSQVQAWLSESFARVNEHSRHRLSLADEESSFWDPLIITTPVLASGGQDWSLWRVGADDVLRVGYYRIMIIRLTERHLGAFVCDYNFVRDVVLNETTHEFHYRDIVSVRTNELSDPYNLPTGEKLTTRQEFILTVASGDSVKVGVDAGMIRAITGIEQVPESGAERAVATIRAMLRDKKALSIAA